MPFFFLLYDSGGSTTQGYRASWKFSIKNSNLTISNNIISGTMTLKSGAKLGFYEVGYVEDYNEYVKSYRDKLSCYPRVLSVRLLNKDGDDELYNFTSTKNNPLTYDISSSPSAIYESSENVTITLKNLDVTEAIENYQKYYGDDAEEIGYILVEIVMETNYPDGYDLRQGSNWDIYNVLTSHSFAELKL